MSSSLPILSCSVFTTGKMHHHPHCLSNEETEAGQGKVPCQRRPWPVQRSAQGFVYAILVSVQIIPFWSRSWAKSQECGVWSMEATVTGGLLCVQCLVRMHTWCQLLVTNTLWGHCHCPPAYREENMRPVRQPDRPPLLGSVKSGPYVPSSRDADSDSTGPAWDNLPRWFPDDPVGRPGLRVTTLN